MFVFIHIPKTGGSTFKQMLRVGLGPKKCDAMAPPSGVIDAKYMRLIRWLYPFGLDCIRSHALVNAHEELSAIPEAKFVTLLRNPIRRSASHYQHSWLSFKGGRTDSCPDFATWAAKPENHNVQVRQLTGDEDVERAKRLIAEETYFVGVTENLRECMQQFCAISSIPMSPDTPDRNVQTKNTVRDGLLNDAESLEVLKSINKLDVELYEHALNVVVPAQNARIDVHEQQFKEPFPDRYRSGRFYTNLIYRPLWKLARACGYFS